jgi:flagellin
MQVYNNVPAFGVWVNYASSVSKMRSSMSKLSSGLRITSAGDDPAGLAMSERMRSQIRNSAMASQNIQNHQAYIRTADSWMQKIHDLLHRMSELAVASNDGTKTETDRKNLQTEFEQMQQEIQRITSGSLARGRFNTKNLFDGGGRSGPNGKAIRTQVGADPGQLFCASSLRLDSRYSGMIGRAPAAFSCGQYALDADGNRINSANGAETRWSMVLSRGGGAGFGTVNGIDVSTQIGAERATAVLQLAIDHLSKQRAVIGAEASRLNHTLDGIRSYQENIMGAESLIRDVDMALESTIFMKNQILTQVGTAMLAQANALPQSVLQLIG